MTTTTTPDLADRIVAAFDTAKASRIECEEGHDWSDADNHRRYLAMLSTARAWKVNATTVAANVARADICDWDYAVAELLDSACDKSDTDGVTLANGLITKVSPGSYRLTW